jgi:hypothetical protein
VFVAPISRMDRGQPEGAGLLAFTAAAAALATGAAAVTSSGRLTAIALSVTQTVGVLWLMRLGTGGPRGWATAAFTTSVAWIPLFLVPCWVYSLDPKLLTTTSALEQPLAITTLSLFALIIGHLWLRSRHRAHQAAPLIPTVPRNASISAVVIWCVFGSVCLGVLMAVNGGPAAYVSNLDKSAQLNRGLLYLIWAVFFLRFAPLAALAARWGSGRSGGRWLIAAFVAGSGVIAVTGARSFLAVAAAQLLLVFVLVRRPIPLRRIVPIALVLGFLIVFGIGSVKRFQGYKMTHPGTSETLPAYLVHVAPREFVRAYVDNYVDGVALIGTARRIVPAHAHYEYGKAVLRLVAKIVPRPFRPSVSEAGPIKRELEPSGGYVYAIPLQAVAYLQFGLPGVLAVFFLAGLLVAAIDRRLEREQPMSIQEALVLVTLTVQIPMLFRSGVPAGAVFLLIDVIGVWVAAVTVTGQTSSEVARFRGRLRIG